MFEGVIWVKLAVNKNSLLDLRHLIIFPAQLCVVLGDSDNLGAVQSTNNERGTHSPTPLTLSQFLSDTLVFSPC